jgi:PAS domain S-box-containing protein
MNMATTQLPSREQVEEALAKRIRELNCLNEIGREIAASPPLAELLPWITERIPPAMQYPDLCKVTIEYDGQFYGMAEAAQLPCQVVNAFWINGQALGRIYVAYTEKHDFLNEESALLGGIATRISSYIENIRLVEQLQHRATELEELTHFLNSIIDNIPNMIFVKDAQDLKFVRWNKANEELLGFGRETVIGKSDRDFFPREEAEFFIAKDREVLAGKQAVDIPEEPIQTATGEVRLLHTRKVPIYGVDGNPRYLLGISEDITERKRAETALRESEQRYQQILDAITDMILVKGPQSRIVWANKAFRDAYGMTNEELRKIIDASFAEPDNTQQYVKDDAYVFEIGQVLDIPEEPFTRYDGQNLVMHTVKSPIFGVDGEVVMTVGVSRDITDRKQAEEALAKRATELETVAQVSMAVSTVLDTTELLQRVVDLTKASFNLYHAHIYLLDQTGDTLILAAGAGDVGRQMVAQEWRIPLYQEQSLVARVARTHQGIIVNDVQQEPDFLPNPLLPETRAEMAAPMIVGGKVIGVLDVQANKVGRFTEEDVRIKTILAAQVAGALQNARQYELTRHQAERELLVNSITQKIQATVTIESALQATVQELGQAFHARSAQVRLETNGDHLAGLVKRNYLYPRASQEDTAELDEQALVEPLLVQGEPIGLLSLLEPKSSPIEAAEVMEAVAERLVSHVENLRLTLQTQQTLAQIEALYNISIRLNAANTLLEILEGIGSVEIAASATSISLSTFEVDETGQPEWSTLAANWTAEPVDPSNNLSIGTRFRLSDFPLSRLWISSPEQAILIGDINQDERIDPFLLSIYQQGNVIATALLPLMVRGNWIGLVNLAWAAPQTFTEHHQRLFNSLAVQIAVAVNNQLLLEQTQGALIEQERLAIDLDSQRSTLQAVLQSIPAGVFVVEAPTGRPLLTNEQAERILGRGISPQATVDDLAEVYAAFRYGTDQLYPQQEMPIARALHGEAIVIDDMEIRRPDGSHALLQVFGAPIRDTAGKITASVAIFQDITERRRAEEALQESEARLQRITANILGMIFQFVMHPDGTLALPYVSAGSQQIYELEPEEIMQDASKIMKLTVT